MSEETPETRLCDICGRRTPHVVKRSRTSSGTSEIATCQEHITMLSGKVKFLDDEGHWVDAPTASN
jgi:hypothetical protein